jgi:tRNA A-37 threonylcarbamoyl transferase component Bud32/tetratricopeptide (TPR) repeat protein
MLLLAALAVHSPAHAQKPKRAQELYEKAQQEKTAAKRIQLFQQAAQSLADDQSAALAPEIARQLATIHCALGREFYLQARWEPAIAHLEKALALDSGFLPALATLALVYFQQGNYDAAIAAYEKVLRLQPTAQLFNNLGAAHEAKGELAAAVAAYSRAVELDSRLAPAQKNLQRAQEKLSRLASNVALEKSASGDSAQSRDSLAVAAVKAPKSNTKTKFAKGRKVETPPPSAKLSGRAAQNDRAANLPKDKKAATVERNEARRSPAASSQTTKKFPPAAPVSGLSSARQPAEPIPKPWPLRKDERIAPSSSPVYKGDSAAAQNKSVVSPVAPQSSETLTPRSLMAAAPASASPTPRSSMKSAAPGSSTKFVVLFAGILLAILAVAQRRRLGHAWLHLKPALIISTVAVSRRVRLLPSRLRRAAVAGDGHANELKPALPEPLGRPRLLADPAHSATPLEAESPEPAPVSGNAPDGPRQPSLQTQAFFAEMIAAEPEIEEFDDAAPAEFDGAAMPTNGHVEHAAVEPSVADILQDAGLSVTSHQLSVTSHQSSVSSNQLPVISHQSSVASNHQPVTSNQLRATSNEQPATSHEQPATDNQRPETSHQSPVSSNQLPATSDQRPETSHQSPVSSNQLPATSDQPQVLGRYRIERKIGKGAMGDIYLAFDPKLDRRVVIKTVCFNLSSSAADTLALKDRVYREARAIAKLGHPNIVVVYDVEDDKDMSYIVMEHIEGQDLRQALASAHRFDHPRALKIVAQVCSALDYAHQAGIIHRDIKPSNIMLLPGDKAKVTDFGIAKIADNFSLTLPGHVLGTPSYMAPEQFEAEVIDGRADIFSLGVVLYELLTGGRPFAGDSLAALAYKIVHKMHIPPSLQNVELPLELDEIVGRALAKNPEERYATALEFREALLALQVEAAHSEVETAQ